jgi:hypothetical protein
VSASAIDGAFVDGAGETQMKSGLTEEMNTAFNASHALLRLKSYTAGTTPTN